MRLNNLEIAEKIFKIMKNKKLTNLTSKNYIKMVKDRPGHDARYALDTSFFKQNIKYKIQNNLYKTLEDTINWYIENDLWIKNVNRSYNHKRQGLND